MFIRKIAKRTALMGWLIAALSITSVPQASAAQTVFYSAFGSSGCVTAYSNNFLNAQRVRTTQSVTITTIRVLVSGGDTTNFQSSNFYLLAHNATGGSLANGAPSTTVLGTYTADAISGTGANRSATFTGNSTIPSGTTFWIAPGQRASIFPYCFWYASNTSLLTQNGVSIDTSTTNSTSSWHRANMSAGTSPVSATWNVPGNDGLVWQFSLENNTTMPVAATLATQSGSLQADFRTVTPLTVNVDSQSRVTFYANGRVIAGCRNIMSSSGTATCNWKPSVHGSYRIYAAANPVSTSYVAANSPTISVGVVARTNKR